MLLKIDYVTRRLSGLVKLSIENEILAKPKLEVIMSQLGLGLGKQSLDLIRSGGELSHLLSTAKTRVYGLISSG